MAANFNQVSGFLVSRTNKKALLVAKYGVSIKVIDFNYVQCLFELMWPPIYNDNAHVHDHYVPPRSCYALVVGCLDVHALFWFG